MTAPLAYCLHLMTGVFRVEDVRLPSTIQGSPRSVCEQGLKEQKWRKSHTLLSCRRPKGVRSLARQGVDPSLCCRLAIGTGTCSWGVLCSSLTLAGAGVCVTPKRNGDLSGEGHLHQFRVLLTGGTPVALCISRGFPWVSIQVLCYVVEWS